MLNIRFSIIITCYNQLDFIQDAIDSALAQKHSSKEIIVVDDASNDGSHERLQQYGPSIHLLRSLSNVGAPEARNRGAARAAGEYLVFLDGDDLLQPWALDVYDTIILQRKAKIIAARQMYFRGALKTSQNAEKPRAAQFVEYKNFVSKDRLGLSASTLVIDRNAFWNAGGWSQGIFHMDCVDLVTKLGCLGPLVLMCTPYTVLYRLHAGNSIHNVPPFLQMTRQIIRTERAGGYGGRQHRLKRYAWLGGPIVFWIKRAIQAGLYQEALDLLFNGSWMICLGTVRRAFLWLRKRPMETLSLGEGANTVCKRADEPTEGVVG